MELVEEELDTRLSAIPENEFKVKSLEDMPEMESLVATWLNVTFPLSFQAEDLFGKEEAEVEGTSFGRINNSYEAKRKLEDPEQIQSLERYVVVHAVDLHWQDHLTEMEEFFARSVGLRGYGQERPAW